IRMLWDMYPESKPTGVSDEDAMKDALVVLKARQEHTKPLNGVFGEVDEKSIDIYNDLFSASGLIDKPIDADKLYTDELIKDINNFDTQKVREFARSYKFDK